MKKIERLFQYLDFKGIAHTSFEKKAKIANGYLNKVKIKGSDLGNNVIDKILIEARDLNKVWLLTGEGEMLNIKNNEAEIY